MRRTRWTTRKRRPRSGAVTVEFAVVAPIFLTIVMGVAQASYLFDVQNQLAVAAREGARVAAMDRTEMLQGGQTTNQKITQDITTFLDANGLPTDAVEVHIVDPVDHTTPFDLDDPANDLQLFELRVETPCSAMCGSTMDLSAKVVFRNARAIIVQ